MVDFGGLADKAKAALGQHGDKVEQGVDKAAEFAKGRFEGHSEHIDNAAGKAKDFIGQQGGQQEPGQQEPGQQEPRQ